MNAPSSRAGNPKKRRMHFDRLKRREFITLLGGAAVTWPLAARAQRSTIPTVGYLHPGTSEPNAHRVAAFRKGLSETGYVEGTNLAIAFRWATNEIDRLPELAADLIRQAVDVIVATGDMSAALAAKSMTTTIPIVFSTAGDPVSTGLVFSLNRPGGNITGISFMNVELGAKRLGLLHELIPGAARFATLVNPGNPLAKNIVADQRAAASAIGRQIEVLHASTNSEIDAAFAILLDKRAEGVVVNPDALYFSRRVQIVTLAARHALPAIYPVREFADVGGLMTYGSSATEQYWQAGVYAGRVLKGEKPANIPVLRASKFEFVINLQTARTLGLEVPPMLLARADEVIE
jgi:putative ABC transport system substrate-binding protein